MGTEHHRNITSRFITSHTELCRRDTSTMLSVHTNDMSANYRTQYIISINLQFIGTADKQNIDLFTQYLWLFLCKTFTINLS